MPLWKKKKAAEPAAPLDVLRWKIVAVNILFAAMVVATLCFVAARQGKNALEEKHRLAFASLCSALEQPILETQTIDHKAIYSSAVENRLVPALFEKGAPIENPYLQGDDAAPLLTLSDPMLEEARQSVDGQNGLLCDFSAESAADALQRCAEDENLMRTIRCGAARFDPAPEALREFHEFIAHCMKFNSET